MLNVCTISVNHQLKMIKDRIASAFHKNDIHKKKESIDFQFYVLTVHNILHKWELNAEKIKFDYIEVLRKKKIFSEACKNSQKHTALLRITEIWVHMH